MNESKESIGVQRRSMLMLISESLFAAAICLFCVQCASVNAPSKKKIQGIALESPAKPDHPEIMGELKAIGADHVCLMPYAFMEDITSDRIQFEHDWQWWGEKSVGIEIMIDQAHAQGIKVMLKPHLWIGNGSFTGLLTFEEDSSRAAWERSYSEYILLYASIAEAKNVDFLCIGTELCSMVRSDPAYWKALVSEVKKVYRGKLTYAANWDTYQEFPWEIGMDFVGVDAYFPLADNDKPNKEMVKQAWAPVKEELKRYSEAKRLPILFTEIGYRSVEYGLRTPWEQGQEGQVNLANQALGYECLFEEVWKEEWMAGAFIWKWHTKGHFSPSDQGHYSPQGKPALDILKREWKGE